MAYKTGEVKVIDNSPQLLRASKSARKAALLAMAMKWDELVTPLVPVDTGYLRNSKGYNERDPAVDVGFTAEYAPYPELGTRRQAANPFLRPSIEGHGEDYKKVVEEVYKNG